MTGIERYEKLLRRLKSTSWGIGRLALLDEEMIKIAIAWPHAPREFTAPATGEKDPWSCIWVDMAALGEIAQIQLPRLKKAFYRLQKLKLIFPDGTVPDEVEGFIRAEVARKVGVKPGAKKQIVQKESNDG